jgi:Delta3,5-Delta2,4-dienoyl-CoA isomerase
VRSVSRLSQVKSPAVAINHHTATIAVLHGISFGLAIDMSACCDIRICSKDVRLSVKEVDIGLAADIGTLSRLPKIVGSLSWVKEVCLSARIFGAEEALAFGLVSQVHENKAKSVEAAFKLAGLIVSKSPVAVQGTKELINHARDNTVADSTSNLALLLVISLTTKQVSSIQLSGTQRCFSRTM